MKVLIKSILFIYFICLQILVAEASELPDMDEYVQTTAKQIKEILSTNEKLIQLNSGSEGTYFIDQRLATDGLVTVDESVTEAYNKNLFQKYNGDVLLILHVIYPEGKGGKKDVLDSTLIYSKRLAALVDPQESKATVHFWSVIDNSATQLYSFFHVVSGKNVSQTIADELKTISADAASCSNVVCSTDKFAGITLQASSSQVNLTKYLTPDFELVQLNEEFYTPIEFSTKGPLFAFASMQSLADVDKGDFYKYDFNQKVYINTYNNKNYVVRPSGVTGSQQDPKIISSEDLKQGRTDKVQTFFSGHLINGQYYLAQRNLLYFFSESIKNDFLKCVTDNNYVSSSFCDIRLLYDGPEQDCWYVLDWSTKSVFQANLNSGLKNAYSLSTLCLKSPNTITVKESFFEGRPSFKIPVKIDIAGLTSEDQKLLRDMVAVNKNKSQAILFVKDGKIFKIDANGEIIQDKSQTYAQLKASIESGNWSDKTIDQMTLLKTESINGKNIVQVDALGYRKDITPSIAASNTKNTHLDALIQSKIQGAPTVRKNDVAAVTKKTINDYLKKNNVENTSSMPSTIDGGDFPDGKSVSIDPGAGCLAIAWEGLSMTTEFLKTAAFDPKIYDDNTPSMIKLPPILTGGIEGGARAVTDITSLVTMGIELTLDDAKRAEVVKGFATLKEQVASNPVVVMELARDAILEELTGLNANAISNISLTTGEGMHNLSKGVAVITLNAASFVATLPKAAGKISLKLAAQNFLNALKKNINLKNKLDEIKKASADQYTQIMKILENFDAKFIESINPAKFNLDYLDELKAMFVKHKTDMVTDGCDQLCAYTKYGGCFVKGTNISVEEGLKPIEQIQKGDTVWSYNTIYKKLEKKSVTSIKRLLVNTLCILVLSDGYVINTTPDHPFYINGTYIEAGALTCGMQLFTKDGRSLYLKSINIKDTLVEVYNFSVPDNNNYFVGNQQILVHNNNKCLLEKFTGGEFPNLSKKFDGLSPDDKTKFLNDFATADDAILAKLDGATEPNFASWQSGKHKKEDFGITSVFKNADELVADIKGKRSTIKSTIQNVAESRDNALAFFNKNKLSMDPAYQNDFNKWFEDVFKNGKATNPAPFEAHHVLPINVLETNKELKDLLFWARNNNMDFDFNGIDNGMMIQKKSLKLDQSGHAYHPKYNEAISAKVTDIITNAESQAEAFLEIQNFISTTKAKLKQDVLLGPLDVNDVISF